MSFLGLVNDSKLSGEFTADAASHLRAMVADMAAEYEVRVRIVSNEIRVSFEKKEQHP